MNAPHHRHAGLATVLLVALAAVWGSTFFMIRDLVETLPSADFLSVRFAIAAAVMLAVFHRQVRALDRRMVLIGVVLGTAYGAAQLFQTVGLEHTSASVSGFVTGTYVVLTPIIGAVLLRERLTWSTWLAVALAATGLAVLSLNLSGGLGSLIGVGELLTLASAAFYALHIVGSGRWARAQIAVGLSTVQAVVIALICTAGAIPDGIQMPVGGEQWLVVLYMAIVAGVGALIVQTWAQSQMNATRAAITMTLEPVFAAAFAVALGGESLTSRMIVGGVLIVGAMYVVELAGRRTTTPVEVHHQV